MGKPNSNNSFCLKQIEQVDRVDLTLEIDPSRRMRVSNKSIRAHLPSFC